MLSEQRSKRLKFILNYIWGYQYVHGYPPSRREIRDRLNVSLETVATDLHILADMGKVEWEKGKARTLRLIGGREERT